MGRVGGRLRGRVEGRRKRWRVAGVVVMKAIARWVIVSLRFWLRRDDAERIGRGDI